MEEKSAHLDLTIISAADLKRKWLSGDRTVAVAWVDPSAKRTTSIVRGSGSNVQWHEKLVLSLNGVDNLVQGKLLTIEIHARGTWGDSLLGSVYVPLVELVSDEVNRGNNTLMYEIIQPSGKRQGSIKFFAKVVKPQMNASITPLSGSIVPLPSAPPIVLSDDDCNSTESNALYPPATSMCPSVEANDERPSSVANSPHPTLEVSSYPPQLNCSQNCAAGQYTWQHDLLPDPSYGMGSYPPHVYPPVDTTCPPCACSAHCSHTFSSHWSPHSNHTGIIPYPPSPPDLETPHLPSAFVYPPPALFSGAPCASIAPYPPIALYPSEMYPFYSYSNFSSPLYPPPYPQRSF